MLFIRQHTIRAIKKREKIIILPTSRKKIKGGDYAID
jgi:hypothetical protein